MSAYNAGDLGSIPGSGRSSREGNGNPLQYPMDGGAWWTIVHGVAKNWTRLSDFTFTGSFSAPYLFVPWGYCIDMYPCCQTHVLPSIESHWVQGFPGGSVVKKPPAEARDRGSIPGSGRSHMLWSSKARAPQLLSLWSRAWKS